MYLLVKRIFDFSLAIVGLIGSAPLCLLLAALIFLEDGRPIFFSQERCGRAGRIFRLYKFRSMKKGQNTILDIPSGPDSRLTSIGRLLRAVALDELPSLYHIVKGDMSFVGPKALLPRVADPADPDGGKSICEVDGFKVRSAVMVGLTGLAQLNAPKNASYRSKFRYDALYVKHLGLWLDLKLLLASFVRTFYGGWERISVKRGKNISKRD